MTDPDDGVGRVAKAITPPILHEFDAWRLDLPVPWEKVCAKDQAKLREIAEVAIAALSTDDTPPKPEIAQAELIARMREALEEVRTIANQRAELNQSADYARGWNASRFRLREKIEALFAALASPDPVEGGN